MQTTGRNHPRCFLLEHELTPGCRPLSAHYGDQVGDWRPREGRDEVLSKELICLVNWAFNFISSHLQYTEKLEKFYYHRDLNRHIKEIPWGRLVSAVLPFLPSLSSVHPVMLFASPALSSFFQAHLCYRTNFLQLKLKERSLLLDK